MESNLALEENFRTLLFFMNLSSNYIMMDVRPYNKDSIGV
jgi:hypothetical protein